MSRSRQFGAWSLIALLFIAARLVIAADSANLSVADIDDEDMGASSAEIGRAWNSLDEAYREQFVKDYRSRANRRELYDEYIGKIGAEAILDYFELNDERCHGKAHTLGNAVFGYYQDINVSLRVCANRCTNACMHGVVKEAFGSHSSDGVKDIMNEFCERGEMNRLHKPGNCAHGIGHALMLLSDHDVTESLEACRGFERAGMDYYCATGVFMEYRDMLKARDAAGDRLIRPSRQYPCDTNTEFPAACYRYMIRQIAAELYADTSTLIDMCMDLPANLRAGCFHGLGAMYSRRVARDPEIFPDLCSHGGPTDQVLCIEGVIEKMADYDQQQAMTVCTMLSGEQRAICEAGAREKMYRLDKPTMRLYRGAP